jgi:WD40 repeat protein
MSDGSLGVWNAATGKEVFAPRVLGQFTVAALAFHPSGKFVACGTFDARGAANVYLVEVRSGEILRKFRAHPSGVFAVGFDRTGDRLAVVVRNAIKIYDARPLLGLQSE